MISAAVEAGRYICLLDPAEAAARDAAMRERARDARPGTAADLIPAIGSGVIAEGTPAAGERFIQPWLESHGKRVLLDDLTGGGWRLFVTDGESAERAGALLAAELPEIPVEVIDVSSLSDRGALAVWLSRRSARAVLVRPDFYAFGTSGSDAAPLIKRLRSSIGARHVPERIGAA